MITSIALTGVYIEEGWNLQDQGEYLPQNSEDWETKCHPKYQNFDTACRKIVQYTLNNSHRLIANKILQ